MKIRNLILMCFFITSMFAGCDGDETPGGGAAGTVVTIDVVATDDIIDTGESKSEAQTVSGTAFGGFIRTGDEVITLVNEIEYSSTVTKDGTYTNEIETIDLISDPSIDISVVSTNGQGGIEINRAFRTISLDIVGGTGDFLHPGLLVTQVDIDRIKGKLIANEEPWVSGWNKLINNSHSRSGYTPHPVERLIRGGNSAEVPEGDNYANAFNDAAAAFQLAVRWKITEDPVYADKAIEILNGWASTCKVIVGNSNRALAAGLYGYQFANAAELMRDYEGWAPEDFKAYQQFMVDVFYSMNKKFLDTHWNNKCIVHFWANWDLANIASIMAIGVLTDDLEMYSFAINFLKTGESNGNLNTAIYYIHPDGLGQLQESGRDQGHATLCVGLFGEIAQMAYSQGDDIFGYDDNRILKGVEYTAKYNIGLMDVPFEPYDNCDNVDHTVISPDARGGNRPIWQLMYNHYVVRKGMDAPYLKLAAENLGVEGGGGDYSHNSGGFDSLGFGTLLYTK